MLTVTASHLRALLDGVSGTPVLYVTRSGGSGEPVGLEVRDEAFVPAGDILLRQHELVDALGGSGHPDGVTTEALEHLLPGFQTELETHLEDAKMVEALAAEEYDCVYHGQTYPEHDYPPRGEGNVCRRCGAETMED